ncbi:hypothetical protein ACFC0C_28080 [Streptomyces sp. NPDC056178]|uniref:hypothetical protein n=1 Tax=unclassified Streptomyces TaxID=2593676 RepID=UPI0035DF8F43
MRKKLIAAILPTAVSAVAAVVLTSPPAAAADSPTWCGNWLSDPAKASNQRTVPGTTMNVGDPGQDIMVREGTYGGKWYAWAKLVNGGQTDLVALGWVNQSNGQYYNCGSLDGTSGWAQRYYTAGVDDAHAYKVQAKYKHSLVQYGPAVIWR